MRVASFGNAPLSMPAPAAQNPGATSFAPPALEPTGGQPGSYATPKFGAIPCCAAACAAPLALIGGAIVAAKKLLGQKPESQI